MKSATKEFLDELAERAKHYGWNGDYAEVKSFVQFLYNSVGLEAPDLTPYTDSLGNSKQLPDDCGCEERTTLRDDLKNSALSMEQVIARQVTRKGVTTDPNDPCIKQIVPGGQQACYLVLSEEERAKGFVRPVRRSYKHVGAPGPMYPLRDLTAEERTLAGYAGYAKFEDYPATERPLIGRGWTQQQLANANKGCGEVTTMGQAIAETYARNPSYYSGTFCVQCGKHFPVGADGEFVWLDDGTRVGT